jgi:hypothetical protein
LDITTEKSTSVQMKGIQNKKIYISRKTLKVVFFHTQLTRMCQLVTFSELSNDVNTTGIGSVCVVASRVAISYGYPVSF